MGGRGSGGGRGGKASAGGGGGSALNKDELVNLYNNISGNPSYTVDERVRAMSSIKKEIDKIDSKEKEKKKVTKKKELSPEEQKKLKAEELKKKRLAALEKARAKRAENLKNGIKNPRKPRVTKAKMSMNSTVSDLKYNLMRNVSSDGSIRNSDFDVVDEGNYTSVYIRHLGQWKYPNGIREEDYDWQVLRSSSSKQINNIVKKLQKQSGRKISWDAGEKQWISFDIEKKKGD